MDWKKIAPWNWFKEEGPAVAVRGEPETARDPLTALRSEMERLFDDTWRRSGFGLAAPPAAGPAAVPLRPSLDISEGRKAYTVRVELPGVEPEDVSIEVEDDRLVIRGEKRRESEEEEEGYHWVERSYGAVQRVLSLPDDADSESIEAKFRNGVLKLLIPKHAARASQARSIEVQAG